MSWLTVTEAQGSQKEGSTIEYIHGVCKLTTQRAGTNTIKIRDARPTGWPVALLLFHLQHSNFLAAPIIHCNVRSPKGRGGSSQ